MNYYEWKEAIKLLKARGWKRAPGPRWSYYKEIGRFHDSRQYKLCVFISKEEIALISTPLAVLLDMKEYSGNRKLKQMILRDKIKRNWGLYDENV